MRRVALVFFALALVTAPAFAGTLYVPILSENGEDASEYSTRIWLTNNGNAPQTVETLLLRMNTDGTANRENAEKNVEKTVIRAGSTTVLEIEGPPGLLEITTTEQGAEDLAVNAEIRNADQKYAKETNSVVPVLSSSSISEAGDTITLQGLRRTEDGVFTNVILVNLGHEETQCTVGVFRAPGSQIAGTALLNLMPLSQVQFPDALALLGEAQVRDVNAQVSCDHPFFAYFTLYEREGGEVLVVQPSATGDSSLARPGDNRPSVPGAILFTQNGTFHVPTPAEPTKIFNIPVPNDRNFSRITVDLDIHQGGWSWDPSANHSLFWLHRGACCWPQWASNIFGFANAFGPGRNEIKVATNADLPRYQERVAYKRGVPFLEGHNYHLNYVYDAAGGVFQLIVTEGGNEVVTVQNAATAKVVRSDNSDAFMIYFGHEDATGVGPERPGYGWRYSNLRVEFVP